MLLHEMEMPMLAPGYYFYEVDPAQRTDAIKCGLKQTHNGKWALKISDPLKTNMTSATHYANSVNKQQADKAFGEGRYWVPAEKVTEQANPAYMSDLLNAKELINNAISNPEARHKYFEYIKSLRAKYGTEYSTEIHKDASKSVNSNNINESDNTDQVTLDIPLVIRLLEYAREDAKTDMDLHFVAEKLTALSNKDCLTMADYNAIVSKD